MPETQAEKEKRIEGTILIADFYGMLDAVAQETEVSPRAIKDNLELKVHSKAGITTMWKRIKEVAEYKARVYREFKELRAQEQEGTRWDKEMLFAFIQKHLADHMGSTVEFVRSYYAQYSTTEQYKREETEDGTPKVSPKGRITIYPAYFEKGEPDKKSILAHELAHRARHVQYPAFVHAKEMELYGSENEGRNFGILLAFEEADATMIQSAIEKRWLGGERTVTPKQNRKRAEGLRNYLNATRTLIDNLYKSPEKVIMNLANLADIK